MSADLTNFLAAHWETWSGLRTEHDGVLRELAGPHPVVLPGQLGEPAARRERLSLPTATFAGGLFAWQDAGETVALEGCLPRDRDGAVITTSALPAPDLALPFALGSMLLSDAELVYAARGLALRVNPENGVLLGLVGFAPTSADDYVRRLRPQHQPKRFLRDPSADLRDPSADLRDPSADLRDPSAGVGV